MHRKGAYASLVVCEHHHRPARSEIPQAHGSIHATGNRLLVALLTLHVRNCHSMPGEHINLRLCAHSQMQADASQPAAMRMSSVGCRLLGVYIHAGKVSIMVPDDLVYFTMCEIFFHQHAYGAGQSVFDICILFSSHENKYRCRSEAARSRMVEI